MRNSHFLPLSTRDAQSLSKDTSKTRQLSREKPGRRMNSYELSTLSHAGCQIQKWPHLIFLTTTQVAGSIIPILQRQKGVTVWVLATPGSIEATHKVPWAVTHTCQQVLGTVWLVPKNKGSLNRQTFCTSRVWVLGHRVASRLHLEDGSLSILWPWHPRMKSYGSSFFPPPSPPLWEENV